jgi:hypothetical protein
MNNKFFILLLMLFLHIIDDYKLQGILANMKQKKWWLEHKDYKELYKNDYLIALAEHSFSWTFMIMLPIAIYLNFNIDRWLHVYIINMLIHACVDDLKANRFKINLITDQLIHIMQIIITWAAFVYSVK